jgi:CubicO group peptidase (beta-lactamase class C family)
MQFDMADEAAFVETAGLVLRWNYTNGNTMLLALMIRDQTGGDAASVLRFARRELFDKLGMEHVTLEFDGAGTPIGSSHMWASARDWARFGQLYLDDGVVASERNLPEGWVDYSARLNPGSETMATAPASGLIAARPAGWPSASGSACRPTRSFYGVARLVANAIVADDK